MKTQQLKDIEFYATPSGQVIISDKEGQRIYEIEDRKFTEAMLEVIMNFYPKAHKALSDLYLPSKLNRSYYEYLIVHRFIRCNYYVYDNRNDIDCDGVFRLEYVPCPLRGECKLCGIVCSPEFNTNLSKRETEVMRLFFRSLQIEKIAETLFISIDTVITHKRNSLAKLGLHSISEFVSFASRNKMFENNID